MGTDRPVTGPCPTTTARPPPGDGRPSRRPRRPATRGPGSRGLGRVGTAPSPLTSTRSQSRRPAACPPTGRAASPNRRRPPGTSRRPAAFPRPRRPCRPPPRRSRPPPRGRSPPSHRHRRTRCRPRPRPRCRPRLPFRPRRRRPSAARRRHRSRPGDPTRLPVRADSALRRSAPPCRRRPWCPHPVRRRPWARGPGARVVLARRSPARRGRAGIGPVGRAGIDRPVRVALDPRLGRSGRFGVGYRRCRRPGA